MTPTQKSLRYLREHGWFVAITEHWNSFARIRQDLFGFIDILAICGNETLGVQTTSWGNVSARRKKILSSYAARLWLCDTRGIVIHGWKKGRKEPKIITITPQDYEHRNPETAILSDVLLQPGPRRNRLPRVRLEKNPRRDQLGETLPAADQQPHHD